MSYLPSAYFDHILCSANNINESFIVNTSQVASFQPSMRIDNKMSKISSNPKYYSEIADAILYLEYKTLSLRLSISLPKAVAYYVKSIASSCAATVATLVLVRIDCAPTTAAKTPVTLRPLLIVRTKMSVAAPQRSKALCIHKQPKRCAITSLTPFTPAPHSPPPRLRLKGKNHKP